MTDARLARTSVRLLRKRFQEDNADLIRLDASGFPNAQTRLARESTRVLYAPLPNFVDTFISATALPTAHTRLGRTEVRVLVPYQALPSGLGVAVWDGSQWVQSPVYTWSGTAWVAAIDVKTWDGSAWV